jgi:hypothetical protein
LAIDLVDPHPNHGLISKALNSIYFGKWGKDYLRSHLLFHEAEQCGNFKNESLQHYGGSKFAVYRELANKIFVSIPPPAILHVPMSEILFNLSIWQDFMIMTIVVSKRMPLFHCALEQNQFEY